MNIKRRYLFHHLIKIQFFFYYSCFGLPFTNYKNYQNKVLIFVQSVQIYKFVPQLTTQFISITLLLRKFCLIILFLNWTLKSLFLSFSFFHEKESKANGQPHTYQDNYLYRFERRDKIIEYFQYYIITTISYIYYIRKTNTEPTDTLIEIQDSNPSISIWYHQQKWTINSDMLNQHAAQQHT